MAGIIYTIENTYFKREKLADERIMKFLTSQDKDLVNDQNKIISQSIDRDLKNFLMPICKGELASLESGLMSLQEKKRPYLSKMLLFLGSACHSADTFLKGFLIDPSQIKTSFVPFV